LERGLGLEREEAGKTPVVWVGVYAETYSESLAGLGWAGPGRAMVFFTEKPSRNQPLAQQKLYSTPSRAAVFTRDRVWPDPIVFFHVGVVRSHPCPSRGQGSVSESSRGQWQDE
jgi:hypothetical protein